MRISPARRLKGTIRLPGDKSISHRAALIAALAMGQSQLTNFSTSRDCASTLSCLAQLGVQIERKGNDVCIQGVGIGGLTRPVEPLDCGNSGSTMRMLSGVLAGHDFSATLTGDESLRARPMARIIEPLQEMGATIESQNGHPPLRVTGQRPLRPITSELPIASAQVKTCLLLAGLHADGRTEVIERLAATRDHTERMLQWFGVNLETSETRSNDTVCAIEGPAHFAGREVQIPGDFSSAAFLVAAATLLPESDLFLEGLGLNPTRTQLLELLRRFGAKIEVTETREVCNELTGTLRIRGITTRVADSKLTGETQVASPTIKIDGQKSAAMIDELPLLAVLGTQIPGGLNIRNARELRYKETDRIAATVTNLRAMGANVEEYEDGLVTTGPARLRGARLDSYGDHRIAMAFTVAALLADGESELAGSQCVSVSFPEFFDCLESVVER